MKIIFAMILWSATLFSNVHNEYIDMALKELGCEESIASSPSIEATMDHYRGTIAPLYKRYLGTREGYLEIASMFDEKRIPVIFALIPYPESKFNPTIHGYGTAGLWQFGRQSAVNYGLTITKKFDERLDPERSSQAAARYILALHKEFGKWYLADLAYAMGEGKLKKLIAANHSDKLSVLLKDPHCPQGTKAHFAKIILLKATILQNAHKK